MKVIFVRSPYTIIVNETGQLLTKVEMVIYAADGAPIYPTIVLEKQIPDTVNRACTFNISPYIKDYLENIAPTSITPTEDDENMFAMVYYSSYYKDALDGEWISVVNDLFTAVNGYTDYTGGYNQLINTDVLCLLNTDVKLMRADNNQYFNVLVDFDNSGGYDLVYRYRNLSNATIENVTVLTSSDDTRVYLLKVPYRTATSGLENGNSVQVRLDTSGDVPAQPFVYFLNGDDCLYTPIKCAFINKFGGWQYLTFFKASSTNYDTKTKEYNLLSDAVDYNPLRGQKKNFNFEQTQKIKVNTGWVDENYIELLADLTNSETVLLDNIPATLTSRQIQKKTRLKDKMINYEMEFEYAFNLINDVN